MTETPLVDAHVHVFTQDMPLVDNPRHAPTYSFTVEQLIATMDAHGVQFGVITDTTLCPQPQKIIDEFEPEFAKLSLVTLMLPWGE